MAGRRLRVSELERDVRAVRTSSRSRRPSGATSPRHRWGSGHVQTLLFSTELWTPARAARWATSHGFRAGKVHETDRYLRLRQSVPRPGWPKRMKELGEGLGILAVVEFAP